MHYYERAKHSYYKELLTAHETELLREHLDSGSNEVEVSNVFQGKEILIATDQEKNYINMLRTTGRYILKDEYKDSENEDKSQIYIPSRSVRGVILDGLHKDILEIKVSGTIQDCLTVIKSYKEAAGDNFYGALIRGRGVLINPFHILTALSLLDNNRLLSGSKRSFSVYIYLYEESLEKASINCDAKEEEVDFNKIEEILNNLMYAYAEDISIVSKTKVIDSNSEQGTVRYVNTNTRNLLEGTNSSDIESYLVPVQLITNGVMYPWYGAAVLLRDKEAETSK
jgi:hypothetical protein